MSLFGATKVEPKDVEVANIPEDSISAVCWSPTSNYLAVASWSSQVRIYEVNDQGQSQGKAEYKHEGPVLCLDWSKVSFCSRFHTAHRAHRSVCIYRTAAGSSAVEQTTLVASTTSEAGRAVNSLLTMGLLGRSSTSRSLDSPWWSQARGTRWAAILCGRIEVEADPPFDSRSPFATGTWLHPTRVSLWPLFLCLNESTVSSRALRLLTRR